MSVPHPKADTPTIARNCPPSALYCALPEGRAIAAAQAGEESPGSTETTVPDNVRRVRFRAGSGKVPQRADRQRLRPGER